MRDEGSTTIELLVLAPVIVLFALMLIGLGRYEIVYQQVLSAARAGAEAASVAVSATSARDVAKAAIQVDRSCHQAPTVVDTSRFRPGSSVRVEVACDVSFSDLLIPGFPGSAHIAGSADFPIDPFRSVVGG